MILTYSIEHLPEDGVLEASECFRYYLILQGSGSCSANHQQFSLESHDVIALPIKIEMKTASESGMTVGCIRVTDQVNLRTNLYHLPGQHTSLLRQLFYMALDMQSVDLPYYDTLRDSMNQLVFAALIAAELAADQLNPVVVNVIQQINADFTNPDFDLHGVIERTGYSINHFRKLFRDETGMPPLEFLNNRRTDYAKELFRQRRSGLSVAEVAHTCGFRDEYYFSRYFKKHEGKTPGQYISEIQ